MQVSRPLSAAATAARRVLMLQAHPVAASFNNAVADTVQNSLQLGGAEVRRRDLYAMPDGELNAQS
jgi:prophage antirepressor-like protein